MYVHTTVQMYQGARLEGRHSGFPIKDDCFSNLKNISDLLSDDKEA